MEKNQWVKVLTVLLLLLPLLILILIILLSSMSYYGQSATTNKIFLPTCTNIYFQQKYTPKNISTFATLSYIMVFIAFLTSLCAFIIFYTKSKNILSTSDSQKQFAYTKEQKQQIIRSENSTLAILYILTAISFFLLIIVLARFLSFFVDSRSSICPLNITSIQIIFIFLVAFLGALLGVLAMLFLYFTYKPWVQQRHIAMQGQQYGYMHSQTDNRLYFSKKKQSLQEAFPIKYAAHDEQNRLKRNNRIKIIHDPQDRLNHSFASELTQKTQFDGGQMEKRKWFRTPAVSNEPSSMKNSSITISRKPRIAYDPQTSIKSPFDKSQGVQNMVREKNSYDPSKQFGFEQGVKSVSIQENLRMQKTISQKVTYDPNVRQIAANVLLQQSDGMQKTVKERQVNDLGNKEGVNLRGSRVQRQQYNPVQKRNNVVTQYSKAANNLQYYQHQNSSVDKNMNKTKYQKNEGKKKKTKSSQKYQQNVQQYNSPIIKKRKKSNQSVKNQDQFKKDGYDLNQKQERRQSGKSANKKKIKKAVNDNQINQPLSKTSLALKINEGLNKSQTSINVNRNVHYKKQSFRRQQFQSEVELLHNNNKKAGRGQYNQTIKRQQSRPTSSSKKRSYQKNEQVRQQSRFRNNAQKDILQNQPSQFKNIQLQLSESVENIKQSNESASSALKPLQVKKIQLDIGQELQNMRQSKSPKRQKAINFNF